MKYWQTTRFGSHLQAQHLDDLEDILNSPAPALDHPATTENLRTHLQRLKPQMDTQSSTGQSTRLPFLLEHMARNKGATAAATIAGAAAGGAIAGPLGIAAGAKSGAFMIAVGAAAAGAAQHYYSPIIARQASAGAMQSARHKRFLLQCACI
ncbi:hypothetical protein WJX79_007189 [Trebouxia sp. C0005]